MSPEGQAAPSRQPRRILLVEDEADIRDSLKELLEASVDALEVTTAASGPEALHLLPGVSPHLIITDYKMPGMTGLEFLRAAQEQLPGAPRILMTAFPDLEVALKAINEAHIEGFFSKPLDAPDIVQRVQSVLEAEEARRQRATAMARAMNLAMDRTKT